MSVLLHTLAINLKEEKTMVTFPDITVAWDFRTAKDT